MPKIKNIIIFVVIGAALVLIYIFFIKSSGDQANLVSSSSTPLPSVSGSPAIDASNGNSMITQDFLTLLLNVRNIKLINSIFSDPAFNSLHDSSIVLIPNGTEGRPNPFAQFGNDSTPVSTAPIPPALPTGTPAKP